MTHVRVSTLGESRCGTLVGIGRARLCIAPRSGPKGVTTAGLLEEDHKPLPRRLPAGRFQAAANFF